MYFLVNLVALPVRYLLVLMGGFVDLGRLIGLLLRALRAGGEASLGQRLGGVLAATPGQ